MESRSSSPSPGQSGQDDREEDADSPVEGEQMEQGQHGRNVNARNFMTLDRNQDTRFQRLESDSEAVAQRSTEQDSDEDYELENANLLHRRRQPESPSAAASSSSTTSAIVAANSGTERNGRHQNYRRNLQEEPGSSNQSSSGVNSVGGSNFFHGAMLLSDEDVDPEIDSAASNHYLSRSNDNQNMQNIENSHDFWQASSSSPSNMISTGAFSVEDELRRLNSDSENHSQREDRERMNFEDQILGSERSDIPQTEEDNEVRQRIEHFDLPSNANNRALQYSVVSVPHFSPQPSTSAGSSSSRNFWHSAAAGPSLAGPSSSSNNTNSNALTLASTSTSANSDISNSNSQYTSSSGNNISTTSVSITSCSVDNSQDPTTSSVGMPPLYSLAANGSPSSVVSSYHLPQHVSMHGGGVLSSSGDVVVGPLPPSGGNIFLSPHGEISNPPSPLGGVVNPAENVEKRAHKDRPESPEAGPSGSQNNAAKRGIDDAVDFIDIYEASERTKKFRSGSGHSSLIDDNGDYQLPDADDVPSLQSPHNEEEEEDNDDSDQVYERPIYQREFSTSEAAAAPRPVSPVNRNPSQNRNEIEVDISDDIPSPHARVRHSPLHFNPHTPADQYMISSSTGVGNDSSPSTPVDLHGDNDLSVHSPYRSNRGIENSREQSPNTFRAGGSRNRIEDDIDDMIDSTVDSSGIPLSDATHPVVENNTENEVNGNGVESSHYEDSSDDENCNMDSSTGRARNRPVSNLIENVDLRQNFAGSNASSNSVSGLQASINIVSDFYGNHSRSCGNSNDGSISTSGQIDDGQFRLVPNQSDDLDIEDDSANEPFDSLERYNDRRRDHNQGSHGAFGRNEISEPHGNGSGKSSFVGNRDGSEAGASTSGSQIDMHSEQSSPRHNGKGHKSGMGAGKTSNRRLIKSSTNATARSLSSSSSTGNNIEIRRINGRENGNGSTGVASVASFNHRPSHQQNRNESNSTTQQNNVNPRTQEISGDAEPPFLSDLNSQQPLSVLEQIQFHHRSLLVPPQQLIDTPDPPNINHGILQRPKLHNGGARNHNFNNNSEVSASLVKNSLNERNSKKQSAPKVAGQSPSHIQDRNEVLVLPSVPNTIDISLAFSGIPQSLSTNVEKVIHHQNQQSQQLKDATVGTVVSAGHHSSILESMTGPLSKRLRTLHSLQQQQDTDNEDRDNPNAKQRAQESHRSQAVPSHMEAPTNGGHGQPVNGGHRETNLLFQHLSRRQGKDENNAPKILSTTPPPSKGPNSSEVVNSIEKEKKFSGEVQQLAFDGPSTSNSSRRLDSHPNGENLTENAQSQGTNTRSNGDPTQGEHTHQDHRKDIFGGTQQTFSVTSIETIGGAASEALRNYGEENLTHSLIQRADSEVYQKNSEINNCHQFATPADLDIRNKKKDLHSENNKKLSAVLEQVMDPGISKRGGTGSNWIDPKNDFVPTFTRSKRRKTKAINSSQKITGPLQGSERLDSIEVRRQPVRTSSNVIQIQDRPVLSRAMASLPSNYLSIRTITKGASMRLNANILRDGNLVSDKGVFAKKMIPKSCRFGPLEGREISLTGQEASSSLLNSMHVPRLTIICDRGEITKIDVSNEGILVLKQLY